MKVVNRSELYGSLVWLFAALIIGIYLTFSFLGYKTPGAEQLVSFLSNVEGWQIYLAAFVAMFLEGLYFVGSVFPGSGLVVLIAIFAQVGGPLSFLVVILCIFVGWCLAGVVNIVLAKVFRKTITDEEREALEVKDRAWSTWFPAFRANYEVAQISEGADVYKVLVSSVRVKFYVSIAMALCTLAVPFFVDVNEVSNEEGFTILGVVGAITLVVGLVKLRRAL